MVVFALRRAGMEAVTAADVNKAQHAIAERLPDLILMDLSIPVIDGWECSRLLKADEKTQHIIILALTAHAMRGDQERALAAGCDGYLSKPISPRKLVDEVKSRLKIE